MSTTTQATGATTGGGALAAFYQPSPIEEAYAIHLLQTVFNIQSFPPSSSQQQQQQEQPTIATTFRITGRIAVPFLSKSGVSRLILRNVWSTVDPYNVGSLIQIEQFHVVLRLITLAQANILSEPTPSNPQALTINGIIQCLHTTSNNQSLSLPTFHDTPIPDHEYLRQLFFQQQQQNQQHQQPGGMSSYGMTGSLTMMPPGNAVDPSAPMNNMTMTTTPTTTPSSSSMPTMIGPSSSSGMTTLPSSTMMTPAVAAPPPSSIQPELVTPPAPVSIDDAFGGLVDIQDAPLPALQGMMGQPEQPQDDLLASSSLQQQQQQQQAPEVGMFGGMATTTAGDNVLSGGYDGVIGVGINTAASGAAVPESAAPGAAPVQLTGDDDDDFGDFAESTATTAMAPIDDVVGAATATATATAASTPSDLGGLSQPAAESITAVVSPSPFGTTPSPGNDDDIFGGFTATTSKTTTTTTTTTPAFHGSSTAASSSNIMDASMMTVMGGGDVMGGDNGVGVGMGGGVGGVSGSLLSSNDATMGLSVMPSQPPPPPPMPPSSTDPTFNTDLSAMHAPVSVSDAFDALVNVEDAPTPSLGGGGGEVATPPAPVVQEHADDDDDDFGDFTDTAGAAAAPPPDGMGAVGPNDDAAALPTASPSLPLGDPSAADSSLIMGGMTNMMSANDGIATTTTTVAPVAEMSDFGAFDQAAASSEKQAGVTMHETAAAAAASTALFGGFGGGAVGQEGASSLSGWDALDALSSTPDAPPPTLSSPSDVVANANEGEIADAPLTDFMSEMTTVSVAENEESGATSSVGTGWDALGALGGGVHDAPMPVSLQSTDPQQEEEPSTSDGFGDFTDAANVGGSTGLSSTDDPSSMIGSPLASPPMAAPEPPPPVSDLPVGGFGETSGAMIQQQQQQQEEEPSTSDGFGDFANADDPSSMMIGSPLANPPMAAPEPPPPVSELPLGDLGRMEDVTDRTLYEDAKGEASSVLVGDGSAASLGTGGVSGADDDPFSAFDAIGAPSQPIALRPLSSFCSAQENADATTGASEVDLFSDARSQASPGADDFGLMGDVAFQSNASNDKDEPLVSISQALEDAKEIGSAMGLFESLPVSADEHVGVEVQGGETAVPPQSAEEDMDDDFGDFNEPSWTQADKGPSSHEADTFGVVPSNDPSSMPISSTTVAEGAGTTNQFDVLEGVQNVDPKLDGDAFDAFGTNPMPMIGSHPRTTAEIDKTTNLGSIAVDDDDDDFGDFTAVQESSGGVDSTPAITAASQNDVFGVNDDDDNNNDDDDDFGDFASFGDFGSEAQASPEVNNAAAAKKAEQKDDWDTFRELSVPTQSAPQASPSDRDILLQTRDSLVKLSLQLPEAIRRLHSGGGSGGHDVVVDFEECFDANIGMELPYSLERRHRVERCNRVMSSLLSTTSDIKLASTYWFQALAVVRDELAVGVSLLEQASSMSSSQIDLARGQLEIYVHGLGEFVRVCRLIVATIGDLLLLDVSALLTIDTWASSWCSLGILQDALEVEKLWKHIDEKSRSLGLTSKQLANHKLESLVEIRVKASSCQGRDIPLCGFTLQPLSNVSNSATSSITLTRIDWEGKCFTACAANFLANKCAFYAVEAS